MVLRSSCCYAVRESGRILNSNDYNTSKNKKTLRTRKSAFQGGPRINLGRTADFRVNEEMAAHPLLPMTSRDASLENGD